MLIIWISIFIVLFIWGKLQQEKRRILFLETEYKVYQLRDKLRHLVIVGKIAKENWVFQYLDSTLTKSAHRLGGVGLYVIITSIIVHRKDESLIRAKDHLFNELSKPENSELADIYMETLVTYGRYLVEKHQIAILFIKTLAFFPLITVNILVNKRDSAEENFGEEILIEPETSTLINYAQVA